MWWNAKGWLSSRLFISLEACIGWFVLSGGFKMWAFTAFLLVWVICFLHPEHTFSPPGQKISRVLPADINSYTIDGLRPGTVYLIEVSALVGSREGTSATTTVTTGETSSGGGWDNAYLSALFATPWESYYQSSLFVLCLEGFDPVGTVTSLRVLESRGNVVRISWVGVPGATAYRVVWSQRSGKEAAKVYWSSVSGFLAIIGLEKLLLTSLLY